MRIVSTSAITACLDRVLLVASHPVSAASAAAFRVMFGLLGLAAVIRFASRGWIDDLYVEPAHHFTYSGFWWVQPWPGWGMYAHFALLGLASVGVALGYRYRLSIVAFFLLFTYVELIDKTTYLNHYYWVSLTSLLMVFLPLHRTASLDAWRNPALRSETVPGWVVWVLRVQVGVVYMFGGIAKMNPDWLLHAQPMRIWLYNNGDLFLVGPLLREAWVAYAMSWAGAAFDLTIVGWLLWRRSRPVAYVVLVVFHVMTWLLFPIGMFPWLMIFGAIVFFPYDWPRRVLSRLRGRPAPVTPEAPSHTFNPSWASRAWLAGLLLFALVQVAMPLRHWAYPGNVQWNEDGYRFSWRIMLTEKTGHVRFRVNRYEDRRAVAGVPRDVPYPAPTRADGLPTRHDTRHRPHHREGRDQPGSQRRGARRRVRDFQWAASGPLHRPKCGSGERRARTKSKELGPSCGYGLLS